MDKTATQSGALTTAQRPGLLQSMAGRYNIEPTKFLGTLKATILSKATDEELMAFCMVAHEYGLNPFTKEIHAFPNKNGGITPVVGVDGWASLMNRRPEFDGIEFDFADDENGKPHSVTARIYIKGRSRPVQITEFFSECQRGSEPWRQMPRRMLRHKALKECARIAFGFAGITDEDEARDIIDVTPAPSATTALPAASSGFRKARQVVPAPEPVQSNPTQEQTVQQETPTANAQAELAAILNAAGYGIDAFNSWATSEGLINCEVTTFDDIETATAAKLVRAKVGMLSGIRSVQGGGK